MTAIAGLIPLPEPQQDDSRAKRPEPATASPWAFTEHHIGLIDLPMPLKTHRLRLPRPFSAPGPIVLMSLQSAIPWRVALQQSLPPLHRLGF
jgi:hypothetical protein